MKIKLMVRCPHCGNGTDARNASIDVPVPLSLVLIGIVMFFVGFLYRGFF